MEAVINLHINCRNFPGLIYNTKTDWFFPWLGEASEFLAKVYRKSLKIEEEVLNNVVGHLVIVHLSMPEFSRQYELI